MDSSFWIEYFLKGPQGPEVAVLLKRPENIVVPSICYVEVGRFLTRVYGEADAQVGLEAMEQAQQLPLDPAIASQAVRLGLKYKLSLADSIIYATAHAMGATLWTMDADFEGLPHVKYFPKTK